MTIFNLFKREKDPNAIPLWTRGFTILTVGSLISFMGSSTISFAMGLLVLDESKSVLMYSIYLFAYNAVKIFVPLLVGPYLDRFSRRKAIYLMDFTAAALYFSLFLSWQFDVFSTWMIYVAAILIGVVDSIYRIAFSSLYPMMVHKRNMDKAFSISSALETMSTMMVPVAAVLYSFIGMKMIFLICATIFCVAAITEIFIEVDESTYVLPETRMTVKRYVADLKDGFRFMLEQRALLLFCLLILFTQLRVGVQNTLLLPFFRELYGEDTGHYWFILVSSLYVSGYGGISFLWYWLRIPNKWRYALVTAFFVLSAVSNTLLLYMPLLVMLPLQYIAGASDISAYNFCEVAVMSGLRDERKARYSGILSMGENLGMLAGELIAGVASSYMRLQDIHGVAGGVTVVTALLFMIVLGRKPFMQLFARHALEVPDKTEQQLPEE